MFERKELIDIRERAFEIARTEGLNEIWRATYATLAQAADHCDAMIARTTFIPSEAVDTALAATGK